MFGVAADVVGFAGLLEASEGLKREGFFLLGALVIGFWLQRDEIASISERPADIKFITAFGRSHNAL